MDLVVRSLEAIAALREVEVVERKGLGHPDTICDAIAEHFSVRLSRYYLERFGAILHHNVDKALLVGGSARPAFGGGEDPSSRLRFTWPAVQHASSTAKPFRWTTWRWRHAASGSGTICPISRRSAR